jgi:guanylate kinase
MSSETRRRGIMFVISSPSGAGKTTLSRRLLAETPGLVLSVSATTRAMRPGERDGVDYHFRTRERFETMIAAGDFLEWATVFDHYYGTPASEVEDRLVAGVDVVFDVDWQGARALKTIRPGDVVSVFILPPSIDALKARLEGRPGATVASVASRLAGAERDIARWGEYDYALVNDELDRAFCELSAILMVERRRRLRASLGHLADELMRDVRGLAAG